MQNVIILYIFSVYSMLEARQAYQIPAAILVKD